MLEYQQLSLEERIEIQVGLRLGLSARTISSSLGRSHTSISREVSRNTQGKEEYLAKRAHERALKKMYYQRTRPPLKNYLLRQYVETGLRKKWSPINIAGRLSLDLPEFSISHEAIYQYIYSKAASKKQLWNCLMHHRKRRRKLHGRNVRSNRLLNTVSIELRPESIKSRSQFGHWETDLMLGKRSDPQVVSVTVERKTRYMVTGLLNNSKASEKTKHLVQRFKHKPVNTITTDNGSENAGHKKVEKRLATKMYFCHPYTSWEKGSVENAIGRLRTFIPKGETIVNLAYQRLAKFTKQYNQTPRKCLNYLTPEEVYINNLVPQGGALQS